MKKKVNNKKNEKYTLSVLGNGFVTISRKGFSILLPGSLRCSWPIF